MELPCLQLGKNMTSVGNLRLVEILYTGYYRIFWDPVRSHRILPTGILNGNNPNHFLYYPTQDPVKSVRNLHKLPYY